LEQNTVLFSNKRERKRQAAKWHRSFQQVLCLTVAVLDFGISYERGPSRYKAMGSLGLEPTFSKIAVPFVFYQ
jgi:hypothetical protein